jgi:hypothetical protein
MVDYSKHKMQVTEHACNIPSDIMKEKKIQEKTLDNFLNREQKKSRN